MPALTSGASRAHVVAVVADLDAERALARRRQADGRIEQAADAPAQAQAFQARGGQHDGVVVAAIELAEPGVEVAAQRLDRQLRMARADLRLAAQAGRADGARRQLGQRGVGVGDEGVARVGALEHGAQLERGLQIDRHVLQGVHGQIGAAVEQGGFEFLDEQALAAHLGQCAVQDLVAPVVRVRSSTAHAGYSVRSRSRMLACHRASRLARVAMTRRCGWDTSHQTKLETMTVATTPMMASTNRP